MVRVAVLGEHCVSVNNARGYERENLSLFTGKAPKILFVTYSGQALEPTQHPIQWTSGTLSPLVKQQERAIHHAPPSNAEVTNASNFTAIRLIDIAAWTYVCLQLIFTIRYTGSLKLCCPSKHWLHTIMKDSL